MRSEIEVRQRLAELMKRRYRQFHQSYTSQCPRNCTWNTRFRVKGQGKVGFCQNPVVLKATGAKTFVCNDTETAQQCKVYRCRNTDESTRQEFDSILRSPERCGEKFPKLAILLWVIQEMKAHTRKSRFAQAFRDSWTAFWRLITFRWW